VLSFGPDLLPISVLSARTPPVSIFLRNVFTLMLIPCQRHHPEQSDQMFAKNELLFLIHRVIMLFNSIIGKRILILFTYQNQTDV